MVMDDGTNVHEVLADGDDLQALVKQSADAESAKARLTDKAMRSLNATSPAASTDD